MINNNLNWRWVFVFCTTVQCATVSATDSADELSLFDAIEMAKLNDPWIKGSEFKQAELNAMAVVAGQLPDPQMSLGLVNIGTDKLNFNQEPMTQFKVGVSQMITRGQTRSLQTAQMSLLAGEQPLLRSNRLALMTSMVSQVWLDAYQAQESIRLIENDRSLFEQLVDLVEASYSSGLGQSRQHDLIRAQLELIRLEDRLTLLKQAQETSAAQLREYISTDDINPSVVQTPAFNLTSQLPEVTLIDEDMVLNNGGKQNTLVDLLLLHPSVKALDLLIEAENKGVELAQQKYKPAWSVNASYGYRGDTMNNQSRADLFSIGVTFELPLFTKNRQDQSLKAAISSTAEKETQKTLLLRQMIASFSANQSQLFRYQQREKLYSASILPQMNLQTEAAITAYTHDDGDFAEVIRAKIAQLNAKIDALEIDVNLTKSKIKLNYLLEGGKQLAKSSNNNLESEHES